MKFLMTFTLCFQLFFAQAQEIETAFVKKTSLKADRFIGVDTFENYYYIIGTTLYKKTLNTLFAYNNTALGNIYSVDLSNPLKIVLFYRDFNTVVILDNRLNELTDSINFSVEDFGKNVASVTLSSNNNLWLYSLDDNVLSLWNYETKKSSLNTQPLSFYKEGFEASKQVSSYKYCWMISNDALLKFNEFGSFVSVEQLDKVKNITPYLNGYFYVENSKIHFTESDKPVPVLLDKSLHQIEQFTVAKNKLYFFDTNVLYIYRVLKK